MSDILILGGYGNFGKRIAAGLVRHNMSVIIAGRSLDKATSLVEQLCRDHPKASITLAVIDIDAPMDRVLQQLRPAVVINACGPFQGRDYSVAETCIRHHIHYIDLADSRAYVKGFTRLDAAACAAGIAVITGASTVPGLSSAVIEHYCDEFATIDEVSFGISPGQKTARGLGTTAAILSYVGTRLQPVTGDSKPRYGWQGLHRQKYPGLGVRWMGNCDIPDLDLFPVRYKIAHVRFAAGLESALLHFGIYALSWLVRLRLPLHLEKHAPFLLRASHWFDRFGTADGGMHMRIEGTGQTGGLHRRQWFMIVKDGDGPWVPCVPAIVLARQLIDGSSLRPGAYPCVGLLSLRDYLSELARFKVAIAER